VSDPQTEPGADQLTDELARKYDPERMLRMISRRAGKGERLEHSLRQKYEHRFGVDLGHVRIYTGEFAEEFNRKRSAYAVTVGSTGMILMGGSPDRAMSSVAGQALLAHELTHVAQAKGGLHRKAQGMPMAKEHEEAEAEGVESEVAAAGGDPGADTRAANDAASAATASKEALDIALEQIKDRVTEMAADAARSMAWRNGSQRRA
jgi:hypothetical protein